MERPIGAYQYFRLIWYLVICDLTMAIKATITNKAFAGMIASFSPPLR
jgi:hypothetical protein